MILFRKIVWLKKSPCDIAIYDSDGSDLILHCIPSKMAVYVLPVRQCLPLIKSFRFIFFFIFFFFKYRKISDSLLVSILKFWRTRVVITYIDNSGQMGKIMTYCPSIRTMAIQNGTRWDFAKPSYKPVYFDYYFSFGEVERKIFQIGGHHVKNFFSVGSLKLGVYKEKYKTHFLEKFDICYISQFFEPIDEGEQEDDWDAEIREAYQNTEIELLKLVVNYAQSNDLRFCVAMRSSLKSGYYKFEYQHFAQCLNRNVLLIPNTEFSSYRAISSSKVIVTISSTLGHEAMALDKRVIFAKDIEAVAKPILAGAWSENLITSKLPSLQRLYSLDQVELNEKITKLLAMTDKEYRKYNQLARKYSMDSNFKDFTQYQIKDKIEILLTELNVTDGR